MPLLMTADWHLNADPRDQYRHDWQAELRDLVREHDVQAVLILGDLTDQRNNRHPASLVNAVVDHLYALSQLVPVIILQGNHDYVSLTETPFFAFLRRIRAITWVGEPCLGRELKNLPSHVVRALDNCLFLPHTPDPSRDWGKRKFSGRVFAHDTFTGARGENNRELTGLDPARFQGATVYAGHIHVPQTVGPVTYIGAPYTVHFGDDFTPRLLLLDEKRARSLPSPGPQKRLLEVKGKNITGKAQAGDIVKIKVNLAAKEYAHWVEIKAELADWAAAQAFRVYAIQPVVSVATPARMAKRARPLNDDRELLKQYANQYRIDKHTTAVGLEFI